jgi:hypothetical protein
MVIENRVSAKLMIMGNIVSAQLMAKNNRVLVLNIWPYPILYYHKLSTKTLFSFAIS